MAVGGFGRPPNLLLFNPYNPRNHFELAFAARRPYMLRFRRLTVKPSLIPIFIIGIVKLGQPPEAILALNRLGAIENLVKFVSLSHPPSEFLEGNRF